MDSKIILGSTSKNDHLNHLNGLNIGCKDLVELAIEVWRLNKKLNKIETQIPEDQNTTIKNSVAKIYRFLELNKITIKDYSNEKYNEGLNLDIIAIEKDSNIKKSIIYNTVTPAVFINGKLIKKARVIIHEK